MVMAKRLHIDVLPAKFSSALDPVYRYREQIYVCCLYLFHFVYKINKKNNLGKPEFTPLELPESPDSVDDEVGTEMKKWQEII